MAFQNAFSVGPCSIALYSLARPEAIFQEPVSTGNVYNIVDPDSELALTLTIDVNGVITLEAAGPLQPETGYNLLLIPSYPLASSTYQLASVSFTDEITDAAGFTDMGVSVLTAFSQIIPTAIPNPMILSTIAASHDGWGLSARYFPH